MKNAGSIAVSYLAKSRDLLPLSQETQWITAVARKAELDPSAVFQNERYERRIPYERMSGSLEATRDLNPFVEIRNKQLFRESACLAVSFQEDLRVLHECARRS